MAETPLSDPLGRMITLHDHTWYGHILPGHHEMNQHRPLIEAAVTNPLEIRISDADPANCRLYFGSGPRAGIMVVVVADVVQGFVKTAHLIKRAKGTVEWSRPMP
jgi:hypothetical protein